MSISSIQTETNPIYFKNTENKKIISQKNPLYKESKKITTYKNPLYSPQPLSQENRIIKSKPCKVKKLDDLIEEHLYSKILLFKSNEHLISNEMKLNLQNDPIIQNLEKKHSLKTNNFQTNQNIQIKQLLQQDPREKLKEQFNLLENEVVTQVIVNQENKKRAAINNLAIGITGIGCCISLMSDNPLTTMGWLALTVNEASKIAMEYVKSPNTHAAFEGWYQKIHNVYNALHNLSDNFPKAGLYFEDGNMRLYTKKAQL